MESLRKLMKNSTKTVSVMDIKKRKHVLEMKYLGYYQ